MIRVRTDLVGAARRMATAPLLCRLRSLVTLSEQEERLIEAMQSGAHSMSLGGQVYTEGEPRVRPWVVASGWACRLRSLPDGRRQIISLFLPGDTIGINELQHPAAQCTITALTDLELLSASRLVDALSDRGGFPNLAAAFAKEPIRRRAQQLDHILRLGRLTAIERTAHFFLELHDRMTNAGLAHDGRYALPLTQTQFGEALGLSLVHVNRTMQQLRRDQLIELKQGWASILDRQRLELLCDYRVTVI